MSGYSAISTKKDALLRKALTGGVHVAASTVTAPTLSTLFDAVTGDISPLPVGFHDLGYLGTDGAKFARSVKTSDVMSWGSAQPTRTDITTDDVTVAFTPQESNLHTIAMFYGVDESTISTTPAANGAIVIDKPVLPQETYRRVLVIGADEDASGETIIARFLPRAKVTAYADQVFQNQANPIEYGMTVTGYLDDTLGFAECVFFGGAGWLAGLVAAGFTAGP